MFWEAQGHESLTHEDMDDAIECALDDIPEDELLGTIEVVGFDQMTVTVDSDLLLQRALEDLDEHYGDPDENGASEPTQAMVEAAKVFAEVLCREYRPWACEEVTRRIINVHEWVAINRPDWFQKESK
jgi:hypothetical protein